MMKRGITGVDVVKALAESGYTELAENILNMLKQRVIGDYMHTAAILDEHFQVMSGVNIRMIIWGREPDIVFRKTLGGDQGNSSQNHVINRIFRRCAMEVNEQLIRAITQAVVEQLHQNGASRKKFRHRKHRIRKPCRKNTDASKHSYDNAARAAQGTDPREIVIGVGAAFQTEIHKTMGGIPLDEVLRNVKAGIEEEGMTSRVVKVLDTSDVCFMALQAAKLSGSGIGIGIQSKGTTVIHQKDLYPLPIWSFSTGASYGFGNLP